MPEPTPQPQLLIVKQEKSMAIAYILLIFLGTFGVHRFYLNRVGGAIAQLLLGVIGGATAFIFIGFVFLAILWVWLFVDLFLTAKMVTQENAKLHART